MGNDPCCASVAFPLGLAKHNARCSSLGITRTPLGRAPIVPRHHIIFAGTSISHTKCRCYANKAYICAGEVCCAAFETLQLKMNTLNCFLDPKSVHRKYTSIQTNSSGTFEPFHQGQGNQYIRFPKPCFPPIWLQCRRRNRENYVLVTVNEYFAHASENRPP